MIFPLKNTHRMWLSRNPCRSMRVEDSYKLNGWGTGQNRNFRLQRGVGENAPQVRTVNFKVLWLACVDWPTLQISFKCFLPVETLALDHCLIEVISYQSQLLSFYNISDCSCAVKQTVLPETPVHGYLQILYLHWCLVGGYPGNGSRGVSLCEYVYVCLTSSCVCTKQALHWTLPSDL